MPSTSEDMRKLPDAFHVAWISFVSRVLCSDVECDVGAWRDIHTHASVECSAPCTKLILRMREHYRTCGNYCEEQEDGLECIDGWSWNWEVYWPSDQTGDCEHESSRRVGCESEFNTVGFRPELGDDGWCQCRRKRPASPQASGLDAMTDGQIIGIGAIAAVVFLACCLGLCTCYWRRCYRRTDVSSGGSEDVLPTTLGDQQKSLQDSRA